MRFGLMVNGAYLQQWQLQALHLLLQDGHQAVVIVVRRDAAVGKSIWQKFRQYPYRYFLYRLWQRFLLRPAAKQAVPIGQLLSDVAVIDCSPIIKGATEWIPEQVARRVAEFQVDFLLRFGFNIIKGSILDVPKYGVWSFHHDDPALIRGGPPGFWEVFYKHEVNGVVLQRLNTKLDAGPVIHKIWLPVIEHSYKAHLDMLLSQSAFMPARACKDISLNGWHTLTTTKTGPLFRNPDNRVMLKFFLRMPIRRLRFHLRHFFRNESWAVGLVRKPLKELLEDKTLENEKIHWLIHPSKAQYYADPFAIAHQGETIILAEHFDYRSGKGRLVRIYPEKNWFTTPIEVPDALHRSFPYLFAYNGQIYCLPECYASRKITLYRYDPDANRLHSPLDLLDGVEAIDPLLFEYQGRWWLIHSQKSLPGVQLFAWYANQPFGPFVSHPLNPLKTDPRNSRNAGAPFVFNGMLIRPAQDVAGAYGKRVILHQVETLNTQQFSEKPIAMLKPGPDWPLQEGMHTFNTIGELCLIDAKTYCSSWAGFRHVWKLKTIKKLE